jgi:hypothetical protein
VLATCDCPNEGASGRLSDSREHVVIHLLKVSQPAAFTITSSVTHVFPLPDTRQRLRLLLRKGLLRL